jgi:protein ImuB
MKRSNCAKAEAENVEPAFALDRLRRGERSMSNVQRPTPKRSAQEILTILHKWGIHTLGQLAALDKQQLGARLGPKAVRMWERANGQSNRVLKLVRPPESFEENFEFEHEIETAEPLLFMLRRFLEQLAVRLGTIYLVAKELTLRITFANAPRVRHGTDSSDWRNRSAEADKQIYERPFKIPQPTNDVDLLFRMLQTHLENFKSEHPIVAVALSVQASKPTREQFGLFETTLRNPHQLSETLARLTALLGADRIGTPVLEETHRPDAFRLEPFSWKVVESGSSAGALAKEDVPSGELPDALRTAHATKIALRRCRPIASASVLLDKDRPAHVRSLEIRGKVIQQRGPYLLSGNWWDEKSWAHAEWDMQLDVGEVVRAHESEGTWKVDGIYD